MVKGRLTVSPVYKKLQACLTRLLDRQDHAQVDGPTSQPGRAAHKQYQYPDIDAIDIRCIRLLPSTEGHKFSMTSRNRLSGGYTALSYEWGPIRPLIDESVRITDEHGGKGFLPITANLRNAITDLKACSLKSSAFFIDQLCINQLNNSEKSIQVAGMRDIYRCADQVVIYLGPAQPGDARALDVLKTLDDRYGEWFDSLRNLDLHKAYRFGFEQVFNASETPKLSDDDYSILRSLCPSLFESGWTKRLWMCQEAILNQNVIFLKGSQIVSTRSVFLLLFTAYEYRLDHKTGHMISQDTSIAAQNIFWARKDRQKEEWYHSLLSLIEKHSTSLACSDPRDMVYAVLGLARDDLGIVPDYHADTVDVFTDLAKRSIERGRDLSVFGYISRWTDEDERPSYLDTTSPWPTWVPTFEGEDASLVTHFAGGSTLAMTKIDSALRILELQGYQIAQIETVARIFDHTFDVDSGSVSWDSAHAFIAAIVAIREVLTRRGIHDVESRLCYGLTDRTFHASEVITDRALQCFLDVLQLGLDTLQQGSSTTSFHFNDTPEGSMARRVTPIPLVFSNDSDGDLAREFWSQFRANDSALCITTNGEILVAPMAVQAGDIVTIFLGGSEVYLLRSIENDRFHMIGLAYLDGYMNGEAVTDTEWEVKLLRILLDLISDKLPPDFSGADVSEIDEAKLLIGILQVFEDAQMGNAVKKDVNDRVDAFKCYTLSKQAEILHRRIREGLDNEHLNTTWRTRWWEMIMSWIDAGYLRSPSWMTKLETYTIV